MPAMGRCFKAPSFLDDLKQKGYRFGVRNELGSSVAILSESENLRPISE